MNKEKLHELFNEIKNNNKINFEKFYKEYNKLIYGIVFSIIKNREDTEDLVQKIFLKIWKMDIDKLPSTNEASWLYTLAKNETINFIRSSKKETSIEDIYFLNNEDEYIDAVMDKDSYNRLIARLEKDEQEIVSLKILANMSFREIAEVLNKPIATIQWKYYKAISTLKILLSNISLFIISILLLHRTKNIKKSEMSENIQTEKTTKKEFFNTITENNEEYDSMRIPMPSNKINTEFDTTENIIVDNSISNNSNVDIGILSFAGIFLFISIIFSIIFIKQVHNKNKLKKVQ